MGDEATIKGNEKLEGKSVLIGTRGIFVSAEENMWNISYLKLICCT